MESRLASKLHDVGPAQETLPVRISYEIIRLFSEGLYQSPHKAVEELVSNGYDAGAMNVFVLTPRTGSKEPEQPDSLWVIDDGVGMDPSGFKQLWIVAESAKATQSITDAERPPIGQFGIGKLAAYVLAWRLTHVSKRNGKYYFTSMNFHDVTEHRQNDPQVKPVNVGLHEIDEGAAKALLEEIRPRDSRAWKRLFGATSSASWTAAALSDFKELFGKFRPGILGWVLRTGLPTVSHFSIYVDGGRLESPKAGSSPIFTVPIGGSNDEQAKKLGLVTSATGVKIPGLKGEVRGSARLFKKKLSSDRADKYGRSHGFFVRVRGRVINLGDELFGLEVLNLAVWSRFVLDIEAEGLRDLLLSSREGVRQTDAVVVLQNYMRAKFNACRNHYLAKQKEELVGLDISTLLKDSPASVLSDPLIDAVKQSFGARTQSSHYITVPDIDEEERSEWLSDFEEGLSEGPFNSLEFKSLGAYDRLAEYDASSGTLVVNEDHPYIAKMLANSKNQTPATLFATAEIMTDALMREAGIDPSVALDLFIARDRALRQIAGQYTPDVADVLRHLSVSDRDKDALERAVGEAFMVLGFHYERRGGNKGGPDGVLDGRLGRGDSGLPDDFKIVYDSKTSGGNSISVGKVHFDALWDFRQTEFAHYGFIIGKRFDGQGDPMSTVNRRTAQGREDRPLTIMLTEQLKRLVQLHSRYGVTLTQVREMFDEALTIHEVDEWLQRLEKWFTETQPPIPVARLLNGLEEAKSDLKSRPNVNAVRAKDERLQDYEPERLIAALKAVEVTVGARWIETNQISGDVRMTQSAQQIFAEFDRRLHDDLGE